VVQMLMLVLMLMLMLMLMLVLVLVQMVVAVKFLMLRLVGVTLVWMGDVWLLHQQGERHGFRSYRLV
jgi:hypothetical protein